jgi:hypothetical protein
MKAEYDELYAYDVAGTITETQFERMLELEDLYHEDQEIYDQFERDRVESLRDNQAKEYNNSKMAVERLRADAAAIEKEQTDQTTENATNAAIAADLTVEIAQLEIDVRELRGDEKDSMKSYIKNEGFKLANAELAVRDGTRALTEIGGRLDAANVLLAAAEEDFAAKEAVHNANLLAAKEEARSAVVDVYNQLEADIYELDDMIDRYYSERNFSKVDELEEILWEKWTQFDVASLDMELINAEEARKAEEAAYILLMEEREELEEGREWNEYLVELEIEDFDAELEELNDDIERLLEANDTNIPQSQIDSNIEKISDYRTEYFTILDERTLKETELDNLIDTHNRERADEAAYDERAAKAAAEKAEWDAEYQQAIADYQDMNSRILELQANIDLY